jgi:uncharacterized protein with NRDE domain
MCIILFAYRHHPRYRLVLAANRDEFYKRASSPVSFWLDHPDLLAGRDLQCGGTWIGVTKAGRFAAVTNYRDPENQKEGTLSRGGLVGSFLQGAEEPKVYLQSVHRKAGWYNGFNLLAGDSRSLWYYSNYQQHVTPVEPGIHGLSNHLLNTPWPKVITGKEKLAAILALPEETWEEAIWRLLTSRDFPPDEQLPATGVSKEWERVLSPIFITGRDYGTRASTMLLIDYQDRIRFVERSYDPIRHEWFRRGFEFQLEAFR